MSETPTYSGENLPPPGATYTINTDGSYNILGRVDEETSKNMLQSKPDNLINNTDFGKQAELITDEFQQVTDLTNLKLNFLKESFTGITQADIKNVKSASDIWGLVETEIFGQTHTYSERKKYFTSKQDEILKYAQENNKNETGLTQNYRGGENQNIILKAYIKDLLFADEQKMNAVNDAIVHDNTTYEIYQDAQPYFLLSQEEQVLKETRRKNNYKEKQKNAFDTAIINNEKREDHAFNDSEINETISLDEKVQKAISRLDSNIQAKKIKVEKNAVKIVSDIENNTMTIIMANGTIHTISPVVFSKHGTGTTPKSRKTPTGSFIIKERLKKARRRKNNVTGYFLRLAGIEESNANSYGREIGIHGMPTDNYTMKNGAAFTHGCTGMTNENIQKLYNLTKGKQTFVETVK